MDTETFLLTRNDICRRMIARRQGMEGAKPSRWAWLGESLAGTLKIVTRLGGNSGLEGLLPKLLLPLAAPLVGLAVGFIKEKGLLFGGKKPLWARFVPFL